MEDKDFEVIKFDDPASDGKSGGPTSHVDRQDNYYGPGTTEGPYRMPSPDMGKAFEEALGGAVKVANAATDLAGKVVNLASGKGQPPTVVLNKERASEGGGIPMWVLLIGAYLLIKSK